MDIDRTISVQIQGLLVFESPLHHDERGYFLENWRKKDLVENGVPESFFHHKLQIMYLSQSRELLEGCTVKAMKN